MQWGKKGLGAPQACAHTHTHTRTDGRTRTESDVMVMANDCCSLCAAVRACDVHAECCDAQRRFVSMIRVNGDREGEGTRGAADVRVCATTKTASAAAPSILCFKHSRASLFSRSHRLAIEAQKARTPLARPPCTVHTFLTPFPRARVCVCAALPSLRYALRSPSGTREKENAQKKRARARDGVAGDGRR